MEAEISKFEADPASTPEQCDDLLRLLLRMHPANDVRWKAIQGAWKRCSSVEKSAHWLKNRAKKLEATDSKAPKDTATAGSSENGKAKQKPDPPSNLQQDTDQDHALKDLILQGLDYQLDHGGSGASGEGLMGALAQAFGDGFDDHAFHTSCEFGRVRNIDQLKKQKGIDFNFRSKDGSTPLLIAMKNKHIAACQALVLMDGVDLDCRWIGNCCDTPLILAVDNGWEQIVEALFYRRANVNIQNSRGITALHKAASIGNSSISRLLLSAAARIDIQDRKGDTALQVARSAGHDEVIKQLLEAKPAAAVHAEVGQSGPSVLEVDSEEASILAVVKSHLAGHKIAAAHACAAEWAAQADGREETGWHLQQFCLQKSPFVWQHHKGLVVEKCHQGFGMKTRISIQAQEPVLAECAAVPWTVKETKDPDWVRSYLSGRDQGLYTLSEDERVPVGSLLEGLWPRSSADFDAALATFPESVQKEVASAGEDVQDPMSLARSSCNSHHDGTHLSVAFFNHSCSPNCEIRGRYHVQLYATRNIEVGEELTISYFQLTNLLKPQPVRGQIFRDTWGSSCACTRCLSGSSEVCDDSFYNEVNIIQQRLHHASVVEFLPVVLKALGGDDIDLGESWKSNLFHLVLQDAVERRLQESDWQTFAISNQRDDLLQLVEALLIAFSNQREIVGESKRLKPLCQAIVQIEDLLRQAERSLPDDALVNLQQVHSLHDALLGA